MILQTDIYTDILIDYDLTPEQFLFLWYVYREDLKSGRKYYEKYKFDVNAIKDLEDRDYIISTRGNGEGYGFHNTVVNVEAMKNLIVDNGYAAALEVWENYPIFININGKKIYSRSTMSKEKFMELYINHIDKNAVLHAKILKIVKNLREKEGYAKMSIEKFIGTEAYIAEEADDSSSIGDTFI